MRSSKLQANYNMINEIQNTTLGSQSLPVQRQIVLDALPATTIELRETYGIIAPAARIFELKARGYNIDKTSIEATTAQNRKDPSFNFT